MFSHFDPWTDFARLSNDLFLTRDPAPTRQRGFAPVVDIHEEKDALVLQAEIPGIKAEDLHIDVEKGVLTLRGERKLAKKPAEGEYHRIERSYGSFARSFSLPETVDAENVEANLTDGVLTLRIPKRPIEQPRRIAVKVS